MREKYPEFVRQLEKQGLIYNRVLGEKDNPNSPIGRGWKSTFLTENKAVAEERFVISKPSGGEMLFRLKGNIFFIILFVWV
ncbi:unnamed protein product [Linum tenue]|uniref:Uncharacterized protein n=1 Tax=Linum tenue TaxID=586396 RepID=A0AAV0KMB2_9ROSI|nr:unnamed protein product [Linum tenue]